MLKTVLKSIGRNRAAPLLKYKLLPALKEYKPIFLFSNGKLPKGFEKFERKSKKKNEDDPEAQTIETNEKKTPSESQKAEAEYKEKDNQPKSDESQKNSQKKEDTSTKETPKQTIKTEEKKEKEEFIEDEKDQQKEKSKKDKEEKGNKKNQDPRMPQKLSARHFVLLSLVGFLFVQSLFQYFYDEQIMTYAEFVTNYLEQKKIDKIVIVPMVDSGNPKPHAFIYSGDEPRKAIVLGNVDNFLENLEKYQLERGVPEDKLIPIEFDNVRDDQAIIDRALSVGHIVVFGALIFLIVKSFRGGLDMLTKGGSGDMFGMGKDKIKVYERSKLKVKFKDVAGLDEAKVEITEFVDFLKTPERFAKVGAKMPRGALLYGPPGTGKTMLAKAAAKEANVQFITMAGSEFVEQYVGVGASRVRELFKAAKENSPCIIFIDEIDAVGKKRESRFGGNDEKDNTLNQLLVEMDGFGTDANVVVLAATNRLDILDPALTRPGRFDRSIELGLPDLEARKEIFMVHLKNIKLDPKKTIEEYARRLATLSPGFSGADIANLCNEAAIMAARKGKNQVSSEEFESASERVLAGLERKKMISEEERKIVAVHESGHAVVSWFLEGGHPLLKLTIIPRSKGSLGFAQYLPNESSLETREELLDRICCILAGRCSEEVFNGKSTTGAYDDLQKAYDIAKNMVTKFGMSEIIGHIGLEEEQYVKKYSEETAQKIDDEIKTILDECEKRTLKMCEEYRPKIQALSEALLEKETLDLQAIVQVLGERPFPPKSNFKAYLEQKKLQDQEIEEIKKKEQEETKKGDDQQKNAEGLASA